MQPDVDDFSRAAQWIDEQGDAGNIGHYREPAARAALATLIATVRAEATAEQRPRCRNDASLVNHTDDDDEDHASIACPKCKAPMADHIVPRVGPAVCPEPRRLDAKPTIPYYKVSEVLDAIEVCIADREIDFEDVTTPDAARDAVLEVLDKVRGDLGLVMQCRSKASPEWVVPAEMLAKAYDHIARLRGVLAQCGQAQVVRESIESLPEVGEQMGRFAQRRPDASADDEASFRAGYKAALSCGQSPVAQTVVTAWEAWRNRSGGSRG